MPLVGRPPQGGVGGLLAEEEVRRLWFAPLDVLLREKAAAKVCRWYVGADRYRATTTHT